MIERKVQQYIFTPEGMKPVKKGHWFRIEDIEELIAMAKKQKKPAKKVLPKK